MFWNGFYCIAWIEYTCNDVSFHLRYRSLKVSKLDEILTGKDGPYFRSRVLSFCKFPNLVLKHIVLSLFEIVGLPGVLY